MPFPQHPLFFPYHKNLPSSFSLAICSRVVSRNLSYEEHTVGRSQQTLWGDASCPVLFLSAFSDAAETYAPFCPVTLFISQYPPCFLLWLSGSACLCVSSAGFPAGAHSCTSWLFCLFVLVLINSLKCPGISRRAGRAVPGRHSQKQCSQPGHRLSGKPSTPTNAKHTVTLAGDTK